MCRNATKYKKEATNMIKTIKELRDFLGENYTIAYQLPNAKKATVDSKKINLPIKKESLLETLKKEVA